MAVAVLLLLGLYFTLCGFMRMAVHHSRTGSTGLRGVVPTGTHGLCAGGLLVAGVIAGAAAPVVALAGWLKPLAGLDHDAVRAIGVVLYSAGTIATVLAQMTMGNSWRVGVDPQEVTDLVTGGPFALVRNPIFSAAMVAMLGLVLLLPNLVAIGSLIAVVAGFELWVRFVEEPYLLETHGTRYADYAASIGRFVPGVGRVRER